MISLIHGDALHIPLADETAQCVITSPPYYGLRDYGVSGQIGLEETPESYIEKMVQVFREVWRVMRKDATLWLNMGDSYASQGGPIKEGGGINDILGGKPEWQDYNRSRKAPNGLKPKDLIGVPWMLAFALRADGWYLRSDIIWHKSNPMPESVTDRPTKAHEYLFLLSKSQRYYYDQEAVREGVTGNTHSRGTKLSPPKEAENTTAGNGHKDWTQYTPDPVSSRNIRSVWTIPTSPYSGAHFATFPPALVEPCLLAGTSERGCCPTCGRPWERVVEHEREATRPGINSKFGDQNNDVRTNGSDKSGLLKRILVTTETTGWRPSCSCPPAEPVPCTVLDPFAGTFTVGMVAMKHRRNAVGIELNPKYIELARKRCADIQIVMPT